MIIDRQLIAHVSRIARLELSDDEANRYLPELEEVLVAFSKLEEVNTDCVEPSVHPVKLGNALREDEVTESLSQEEALSNSPSAKDGYFKGPRAI
jgi:aspartyl-tRNA(Asn)/glutamyl-tRNA(Gln) amidotransferase subunit C